MRHAVRHKQKITFKCLWILKFIVQNREKILCVPVKGRICSLSGCQSIYNQSSVQLSIERLETSEVHFLIP